jgi:hypothetical protein
VRWIDKVSMNMREVVGGSSVLIGFGGIATAGWSPATEHVKVVVPCGHRFVRWFCAGRVLQQHKSFSFSFFFFF